MTIREMQERKRELGYSYAKIAELSAVPVGTVQKVLGGITHTPRHGTLVALERVLGTSSGMVCDPAVPYGTKSQGRYTTDDLDQFPENIRVELIDGVVYLMNMPKVIHQLISGYIYSRLLQYVTEKGEECLLLIAPTGVRLDRDDRTLVIPDIMIVCDRFKLTESFVYGAPDFIVEVMSESTKQKDSFVKLNKYQNAGVREYWMIDAQKQKVIVYDFEHDEYPVIYGFDAKVPVQIWDGEAKIDFTEVYAHIKFLYKQEGTE